MQIEIRSKKQIAAILEKRMKEKGIAKTKIVEDCELSRNSVYRVLQSGGAKGSYNIDFLIKMCKELGIKLYLEF